MIFQIDINLNEILYAHLPCDTFAQRLKKAKLIAGFSQKTLAAATGLSLSTINELEAGYRDTISRDTLIKLLGVLDKDVLCDDYCLFILEQEKTIKGLIDKYGIRNICDSLKVHRSTLERWKNFKYQINRSNYLLILNLLQ